MQRSNSRRAHRLGDQIMREVATIITQEIGDPRTEMVTVSGVRMNKDLSIAEVLYTSYGTDEDREAAALALDKATGHIRSLLGKRLRNKYLPKIRFVYDEYLEDMVYDHPQNDD
ncbi:30S ribosome-binding factor RbfA [Desulfobaculum sp. SPO524]|uniref:30S ribosome-binding factor RbfA n=1 Tax=Desulfobaculum sp. SPO524 TaxID=3378071 RepID=UPI0038555D44